MNKKQSNGFLQTRCWRKSGGLQARMTFSYVWVTALFVLLLEIVASFLFILFAIFQRDTNDLPMAQRIGIQYAYAASLQSDGLVLNPHTTFRPGQPYSLVPLGERVPGENARRTEDLLNQTVPYVS